MKYTQISLLQRSAKNTVLVLKGSRWGTDKDMVSLLGTHFDSVTTSPGL